MSKEKEKTETKRVDVIHEPFKGFKKETLLDLINRPMTAKIEKISGQVALACPSDITDDELWHGLELLVFRGKRNFSQAQTKHADCTWARLTTVPIREGGGKKVSLPAVVKTAIDVAVSTIGAKKATGELEKMFNLQGAGRTFEEFAAAAVTAYVTGYTVNGKKLAKPLNTSLLEKTGGKEKKLFRETYKDQIAAMVAAKVQEMFTGQAVELETEIF